MAAGQQNPQATGTAGAAGAAAAAGPEAAAEPKSVDELLASIPDAFWERIKYFAFDFDRTVLRIHSYAKGFSPMDVDERDIEDDVADYELFTKLIPFLHKRNVKFAIASFGRRDVIQRYLDRIFGNEGEEGNPYFNDDNIITPSVVEIDGETPYPDGSSMRTGKVLQLDYWLINKCGVKNGPDDPPLEHTRSQVLFFDDDSRNTIIAKLFGYIFSLHTPHGFVRPAMEEAIRWVPEETVERKVEMVINTAVAVKVSAMKQMGLNNGPGGPQVSEIDED